MTGKQRTVRLLALFAGANKVAKKASLFVTPFVIK